MNINDYKDGNGNVLVSEQLISDLIVAIQGKVTSGSNANGSWVKFDDGTMICKGTVNNSGGFAINVPDGALYSSTPIVVNFPVLFVGETPSFTVTSPANSSVFIIGAQAISNAQARYSVYATGALPTRYDNHIWVAIGRWK